MELLKPLIAILLIIGDIGYTVYGLLKKKHINTNKETAKEEIITLQINIGDLLDLNKDFLQAKLEY